jgi:hypothetical protein
MSGIEEAASWQGRESARQTNTRYRLRRVIEYRTREDTQPDPTRQGMPLRPVPVADLIGDCGHTLETLVRPQPWLTRMWTQRIAEGESNPQARGLKKRCHRCPIAADKPIPVDHCQYTWKTEAGDRTCSIRARFRTLEWGGENGADLCGRHHNHLVREGYIRPAYKYSAAELVANQALRESQERLREALAARSLEPVERQSLQLLEGAPVDD